MCQTGSLLVALSILCMYVLALAPINSTHIVLLFLLVWRYCLYMGGRGGGFIVGIHHQSCHGGVASFHHHWYYWWLGFFLVERWLLVIYIIHNSFWLRMGCTGVVGIHHQNHLGGIWNFLLGNCHGVQGFSLVTRLTTHLWQCHWGTLSLCFCTI